MLIIDGNSVYEIDEDCLKKREVSDLCGISEAMRKGREDLPKEKEEKKE